jgi:TolB-like protein/class 3 adenylate cyclase/Flp pilus assembly protein TadD
MAHTHVQRRLAAILAADVVGYTRLMGADETGTHTRLKALRRELIDPTIKAHGGRVVKSTGDGVLVEFPSAVEAVTCAVEVQRSMIDRNAGTPEDTRIVFRIGLNIGDLIIEDGDIYGDGVNVAARLEGLSPPGGLCVSAKVYEEVRDKLPYPFTDEGEQQVKNVSRPVRAYMLSATQIAEGEVSSAPISNDNLRTDPRARHSRKIIAAVVALLLTGGTGVWLWHDRHPIEQQPVARAAKAVGAPQAALPPSAAPRLSMVVLPFSNLSNDPEQDYFADGLTEDLTTDLALIPGSFVIARNTAFTYKGKPVDVKQVGKELGVRYVLEGSVRRTGDHVRINAQLIETESGSHIWADRFDVERSKLSEAQAEIMSKIGRRLNIELLHAEARRIEKEARGNPSAADDVMRGWATYNKPMSPESRAEAQRLFKQALTTDPNAIDAMIGFATVVTANMNAGWEVSAGDKELAKKYIAISTHEQPNNALAHFAKGRFLRGVGALEEAAQEQELALRLNPNFGNASLELSILLNFLGRPSESLVYNERSMRLDPYSPQAATMAWVRGYSYLMLERYAEAIQSFEKANLSSSRLWFVHHDLAAALAMSGRMDDAKKAYSEHLRLRPELNTIEQVVVAAPWIKTSAQHWAMRDRTLNEGLRRIGIPER